MAAITDPDGEGRAIRWAAEQSDVAVLIQAYRHWYNWADAAEWATGDAFLRQIGRLAAGNEMAIAFLVGELQRYSDRRSKSSMYLYHAAEDALLEAANQGDPLATAAWQQLQA